MRVQGGVLLGAPGGVGERAALLELVGHGDDERLLAAGPIEVGEVQIRVHIVAALPHERHRLLGADLLSLVEVRAGVAVLGVLEVTRTAREYSNRTMDVLTRTLAEGVQRPGRLRASTIDRVSSMA